MTEGLRTPERSALGLDNLLIDVKLSVPQLRSGLVSRAPLIDAARASDAIAVGVTAPAGYGKSTLMAEWAQRDDRRVGWITLDRLDDDPSALLFLLASAYERAVPEQGGVVAALSGLGVSALGRGAPRLASAFSQTPMPFVLLLDDLHELQSPACHDVLGVVLAGIPHNSQFVVASRAEQPHLPRLRAAGETVELHAPDLALDARGAQQVFATAHVPLTSDQAAAVTERTEGWPVGLHLAAMIARDARQEDWSVSGDDRFVADYLYQEALSHLDPGIQRFLRRTSVLHQLHGPLCDTLLGESDGQDRLRALEASNSFLIPLDRRREWYRYHPLFREFLLGELRRFEPELVEKLHLRAADWYQANGSPAMALEYLLDTSVRDRSVQLVTELVLPTYSSGQLSTVERWLDRLGDDAIAGYPPLIVLAGWVDALAGRAAGAQRWADAAENASFELVPLDGTASFESSRAMLRAMMCASGPEQMLADAELAVAQEAAWSPWRDTALILSAMAHHLSGDVERACVIYAETTAVGLELGNTDTVLFGESEQALVAMDQGRWDDAARHQDLAMRTVDDNQLHDYSITIMTFAAAARLAVHHGDLAEADRQLTRAMRVRPACTYVLPHLAVRGRLQLAKIYWTRGDQSSARHLLREIDDILLHRPLLGVLVDQVEELRDLVSSSAAAGGGGATPLTPAELRLLPYLQTHLSVAEIGERLFVSRNTVSSEMASVYRKLGVSSRSRAVEHATMIGLLGG